MVPWLVQFPQAREAPSHVRRGLRDLDPTSEVVYLGPRQWMVGRVRPNVLAYKQAVDMLDNADTMSVRASDTTSRRARVAFALLALQGFRPVEQYTLRDLDSRVVRDFQISQWKMLHIRDMELLDSLDEPEREARELAHRELTSYDRAKDAHRYITTSNFGPAVSSVLSSKGILR